MTRSRGRDRRLFLRASREIEYVKQHGRRVSTATFNLLICRTETGACRVGIVVGKRFGLAVKRNRAKRLFRELARQAHAQLAAGYTLIVFPKRDALDVPFETLRNSWLVTLKRQGVLRSDEG